MMTFGGNLTMHGTKLVATMTFAKSGKP